MKRVLLTGASGFVGRNCLSPLAARGYEVYAVSSRGVDNASFPSANWYTADLLDEEQVSDLIDSIQPTHLLHCAWFAVPRTYWTAVENFHWVRAGLHLLETFASHGGQRFVGVGSCAEYDWRFGSLSEATTPLNPATPYGICKHALQLLSRAFAKSTGLSYAWGRLFFLYGPHEHRNRLVASVICSLLNEEPALCSQGQQQRDFLYVLDAADALVALLDSALEGPINIGSGEAISVADIVTQVAEQLGKTELIQLGAIPSPKNEPPLLTADPTRLRNELRWSPTYSLTEGLRETIQWWKLQH